MTTQINLSESTLNEDGSMNVNMVEVEKENTPTVDSEMMEQAVKFYNTYLKRGKKDREQWANLGGVLKQAKDMFDGNTKKYGAWCKENFPALSASNKSYAIKLHEEFDLCELWAVKFKPDMHTPQHVYQGAKKWYDETFNKVEPDKPDNGGGSEDEIEVEEEDTPIENLIKTLHNSAHDIVKRQTVLTATDKDMLRESLKAINAMLAASELKAA